jgi:hypothetical protein
MLPIQHLRKLVGGCINPVFTLVFLKDFSGCIKLSLLVCLQIFSFQNTLLALTVFLNVVWRHMNGKHPGVSNIVHYIGTLYTIFTSRHPGQRIRIYKITTVKVKLTMYPIYLSSLLITSYTIYLFISHHSQWDHAG